MSEKPGGEAVLVAKPTIGEATINGARLERAVARLEAVQCVAAQC